MAELNRDQAFELIRRNIDRHGHHIYVVSGGDAVPRFAYTVGLSPAAGAELVLAGAIVFSAAEVERIVNRAAAVLRADPLARGCSVEGLGSFTLTPVHDSWSEMLLLGALDFLGLKTVRALQIVPDEAHVTVDVPEMQRPFDPAVEPVWQWLRLPWPHDVPVASTATTNLDALRGSRVTEAARWEETVWELFAGAGPDVPAEDIRIVPLGTLLAVDASLAPVLGLQIGQALWRDEDDGDWQPWGRSDAAGES
jgi:hypothetical protein